MKYSGDIDELCYPFIYEQSSVCDFEILTDELCTLVGLAGCACDEASQDIAEDLFALQPKIFDLNGSIRGKCAITEADIDQLKDRYHHFLSLLTGEKKVFVLPRGRGACIQLHQARSVSKKAIRMLVKAEQEGQTLPDTLHRYANLLTNYFFALTLVINERGGVIEPEYTSNNYKLKVK
ncbi:cobalamin adenosyltransferase [Reinekea forsetii]|nr:cobalamin adenosyltransferase [Reinekea forsetii]